MQAIESFDYRVRDNKPEFKQLEDEADALIGVFNVAVKQFNKRVSLYKEQLDKQREETRKLNTWQYHLTHEVIDGVDHYAIVRSTTLEVFPKEDTEYYKNIEFQGFKVINNVYVVSHWTKGNHILFKNGELLSDEEVAQLKAGIIPERIIFTKPSFY